MEGGQAEAGGLEDNDKPFSWETLAPQTQTSPEDGERSRCAKGKLMAVPVAWIWCVDAGCFQGSQPVIGTKGSHSLREALKFQLRDKLKRL